MLTERTVSEQRKMSPWFYIAQNRLINGCTQLKYDSDIVNYHKDWWGHM